MFLEAEFDIGAVPFNYPKNLDHLDEQTAASPGPCSYGGILSMLLL